MNSLPAFLLGFLAPIIILCLLERVLQRGGMYGTRYKVPARAVYHDSFFGCLFDTIRIHTWLRLQRNPLRNGIPVSTLAMLAVFLALPACTATKVALPASSAPAAAPSAATLIKTDLAAAATKINAIAGDALVDIQSPAGQAILNTLTTAAETVGSDAKAGNDATAVIAGLEGAAGALNKYSYLPTASSNGTLTQAANDAANVAAVAANVTPGIVSLVAQAQKAGLTQQSALQAVIAGLYAVRTVTAPATVPAS